MRVKFLPLSIYKMTLPYSSMYIREKSKYLNAQSKSVQFINNVLTVLKHDLVRLDELSTSYTFLEGVTQETLDQYTALMRINNTKAFHVFHSQYFTLWVLLYKQKKYSFRIVYKRTKVHKTQIRVAKFSASLKHTINQAPKDETSIWIARTLLFSTFKNLLTQTVSKITKIH